MNIAAPARVALIGLGALGTQIARGIVDGAAGHYRLTGVLARTSAATARPGHLDPDVRWCTTLDELLETRPDFVVEAASAEALREVALRCLGARAHLVVLSTGAFADEAFLQAATAAAVYAGRKIHLASGAIGGLDIVQAARIGGQLTARITTEKPPGALRGAPGVDQTQLDAVEPQDVFHGSARDAIQRFPQNVNVAVTLALAACGLDDTSVTVRSNPALSRNQHSIELEGAFGRARIEVEASASKDSPRSSALASYSVLALLKRLASPVQV